MRVVFLRTVTSQVYIVYDVIARLLGKWNVVILLIFGLMLLNIQDTVSRGCFFAYTAIPN